MGVHGDKTVVGGKTSTLNSLSPLNSKRKNLNAAEISSGSSILKSNSKKSSTSSTTAAGYAIGIRSNASASVDANMAPALTEPLSPTDKLSSAAATSVSPTTSTISTENEERKLEASSSSSRSSPANREKRSTTRSSVVVSTSTRVTRSKDTAAATAAAQERAQTPSATTTVRDSPTTPGLSLRKSKRNSKEQDNEQMGLSVATPTAAATTSTTTETTTTASSSSSTTANNNNNNNIVCKDNSTAQLLADLTTDFEETITAEICLRKQLPEVKVTTPDAAQLSASSETESETTASKSGGTGGGETPEIVNTSAKHMDDNVADNASGSSNVCKIDNDDIQTKVTATTITEEHQIKIQNVSKNLPDTLEPKTAAATNTTTANLPLDHKSCAVVSAVVLDLPPVNSDSTMTASEEEPEELDALEAKLSQLDGTAVENTIATFVDDTANATLTPSTFATTTVVTATTTPAPHLQTHTTLQTPQPQPMTSNLTPTPTQQQLLLTPTGSTSSSHMLALTPQSTSSLLREVNAVSNVGVGGATSGGGGELEDQELEEVLKALKGFDANAAGAEGVLCDLNVLLNEVYTTFNCDEIAAATTTTTTAATNNGTGVVSSNSGIGLGSLHTQQQQQLQHSSIASSSTTAAKLSTSPLKELHAEIEKKQHIMQRKIDIILRRLRKLQVRYMSKHTTEEIAGLFELAARITHKGTNSDATQSTKDLPAASVISARPPPRSWEEDLKTAISSTEMLNLLERLEKSANSQQICTTTMSNASLSPIYASPTISKTQQMRNSKKMFDLSSSATGVATLSSSTATKTTATGATSSSCTTITAAATDGGDTHRSDDCVIPVLNPQVVDEITHVTGMLRAEMRDIQVAYDSDATESSSGGESADEMVAYNNQVQQSLSIVKRAAWRYSRERAAIASRWSWLLSQIADLEIKIRQHSELFQEVVRTKGAVVCEEELQSRVAAGNTSREPLINAYGEQENEIILPGACRTRGFLPSQFRKRKMLQTTSLHTISKKAARPSTIKCGCQCPLNPCALCTGRTDPTAPRDLPDTMMFSERVALLDPGFHPVLSFSDNVSNSIHFEAIARTPHWQNRIVRIQPKSVVRSVWKAEREAANLNSHHSSRKYGDILMPTQKRRYVRRKERNAAMSNSQQQQQTNKSNNSADLDGITTGGSTEFAVPMPATITTPPVSSTFETATLTITTTTTGTGTTLTTGAAGNGTASTTTTTPLVANKITSNNVISTSKRISHCLPAGDGVILQPHSPNNSNNNHQPNINSCRTPQNYAPYNPSQTPSSLISNSQQQQNNNSSNNKRRHYKQRKSAVSLQQQFSNTSSSNNSYNNNISQSNNIQHLQQQQQQYSYNNNTTQNNLNGDINFDYWDPAGSGGVRSRTASPTHGGIIGGSSSNYHKYERSLERRNRISYDIDNIVIPYSVAAATRVEILPYKEIPTPKWRVFGHELTFDQEQYEEIKPIEELLNKEIRLNTMQHNDLKEASVVTINNLDESKDKRAVNNGDVNDDDSQNFAKPAKAAKLAGNALIIKQINKKTEIEKLFTSPKGKICDKTNVNCAANVTATKIGDDIDEQAPPPAKRLKVEARVENSIENSEKINCCKDDDDDAQEIILAADLEEDITDETFNLRHERALHEERRKFQTYLKFPWSTRSRANRRIDSRAESSGANTPDPASPAPNTPSLGGGDQESIPSPIAPSTPLTPLDAINETPESGSISTTSAAATAPPCFPLNVAAILSNYSNSGSSKRNERRRTTSTRTQYSTERNERRSLTPDSREVPSFIIPPFEPLKFPLTDETYEMLASVTFLPPSVGSFYGDSVGVDFQKQHDFNEQLNAANSSTGSIGGDGASATSNSFGLYKTITPRNGRRTNLTSKVTTTIAVSYVANGRKRRRPYRRQQSILDAEHKVADSNEDDIQMRAAPLINGKMINAATANSVTTNIPLTAHSTDIDDDCDDNDDDEDDFYDELADDDDDGYPKHPLAPGMDIDNLIDDDYDRYGSGIGVAGGGGSGGGIRLGNHTNNHLGLSDSEFSEPDPFEDDDPNDPEWKGESSHKTERQSERLRKRSYF